jgi:hypothetical protein
MRCIVYSDSPTRDMPSRSSLVTTCSPEDGLSVCSLSLGNLVWSCRLI